MKENDGEMSLVNASFSMHNLSIEKMNEIESMSMPFVCSSPDSFLFVSIDDAVPRRVSPLDRQRAQSRL